MANKCKTKRDEIWVCWITKQGEMPEGAFNVETEDEEGNFEGFHSGEKIKGSCDGTRITFRRPATSSRFEYTGKFSPNGKKINGKRRSLRKRRQVEEDWEGVKTTT